MSPYSFVIDMGVGKSIQQFLKTRNFTVHCIDVINSEMEDTAIIEFAREQQSIIITMDKDFGELIFKENKIHAGILLLRLEDATADEKLAVIQHIVENFISPLPNNFSVYQNGILRTRTY